MTQTVIKSSNNTYIRYFSHENDVVVPSDGTAYAVTLQRQLRNPFVPIRRSWCGRAPACRLDHSPVTSALDRLGPEQPLHAPQLCVKLARAASLFDEGVHAYMHMHMHMHKHAQCAYTCTCCMRVHVDTGVSACITRDAPAP